MTCVVAAVAALFLAVVGASAWFQTAGVPEPIIFGMSSPDPSGVDAVEVSDQPGTLCQFTNAAFNNQATDAAAAIWWDDAFSTNLVYIPRTTAPPTMDVYLMQPTYPYTWLGSFLLTASTTLPSSVTVQITTGNVIVAQGSTVGYYSPTGTVLGSYYCQNLWFYHVSGTCTGGLAALAGDLVATPPNLVWACVPAAPPAGTCAGCGPPTTVSLGAAQNENPEYLCSDRRGDWYMVTSIGAGRTGGNIYNFRVARGTVLTMAGFGGVYVFPRLPDPATPCELSVLVAQQSPTLSTPVLFEISQPPLTLLSSYTYPAGFNVLGVINVETAGAAPGNFWVSTVETATGRVVYDRFVPTRPFFGALPCGLSTWVRFLTPWTRGSGSRYGTLVCPVCP